MMRNLLVVTSVLALFVAPCWADRGGWADPPGGWSFVEDWGSVPLYENDPKWDHNNGSDSWSGGANDAIIAEFEVSIRPGEPVGDLVRIDTVVGEGETEDGVTPAADAKALTLIDIGDPRDIPGVVDPSDRKIFFLGALHEPGDPVFDEDPFIRGFTFAARFKIFPIFADPDFGGDGLNIDPESILTFIPERSDRAHVGIGYVDPAFPIENMLVGVGYYAEGGMQILVNDKEDPDEDENLDIITGIDTTKFHSVWVSAQADPNDLNIINVRAFADGSTTPVVTQLFRGPDAVDQPQPEDLQDNTEWAGFPELSFNIGSAGTGAVGAFQFDYMVATTAGAFDPQPAGGGTDVAEWSLY